MSQTRTKNKKDEWLSIKYEGLEEVELNWPVFSPLVIYASKYFLFYQPQPLALGPNKERIFVENPFPRSGVSYLFDFKSLLATRLKGAACDIAVGECDRKALVKTEI